MTLVLGRERTRLPSLSTALPAILVLIYVALEGALFAVHDAWQDEAHAWLWARELSGLQFLVVPGEGHPPIWFWILRALSTFLHFDQARAVFIGVAAVNAILLARLFRSHVLVLTLLLGSSIVLQTWGFHFRPYGLVFTCLLSALLFDRAGRTTAALCVFAIACGLHFFSGLFMAFYLIVLLRRGTPVRTLLAPAAVAALFGLSAILSGMGNQESAVHFRHFGLTFLEVLSSPFRINLIPTWLAAPFAVVFVIVGLRRNLFLLVTAGALCLLFSCFATLVYGASEWHVAFMLMLVVMAFTLAGDTAPKWALGLLLVPQFLLGYAGSVNTIRNPERAESEAYAAIVADAGDRLDTTRNLVAWPDYAGSTAAARHDIEYLSGNTGEVIYTIDLRRRYHRQMDVQFLMNHPGPYWLLCNQCEIPVAFIKASGRKVVEIYEPTAHLVDQFFGAYRIED